MKTKTVPKLCLTSLLISESFKKFQYFLKMKVHSLHKIYNLNYSKDHKLDMIKFAMFLSNHCGNNH